jgi:hypothetical protein
MKLTEEEKSWLKEVVDYFEREDLDVRNRQIRMYRKLKLLWDGFQKVWYSEVAHDWRIWDEQQDNDVNAQDYYDKPINVFRAYLESIIAALSVVIPPIKCYPDDADDALDLLTAKAGDKISELIDKHNNVSLLWLHALYIYCTEGMIACYNYTREDEKYGTYKKEKYEDVDEEVESSVCPSCGNKMNMSDEYDPSSEDGTSICPSCLETVEPQIKKETFKVNRLVGEINHPKSRQCMEIYGGLYVKIANYAKCQADTPYLGFSYETNFGFAREWYPDIRDEILPGSNNTSEPYARWGRNNPQYYGAVPIDTVTVRNYWLRHSAFQILDKERCDKLKKKFPNGAKVVFIDQTFAEACDESLDDHWTLTHNPLSDYLTFDPIGLLLTSIQEITNDLVSLTLQTIEHGIPQTFADPSVLNFDAYRQMESTPGALYPTNRLPGGKDVKSGFYEVKTATLSQEVLPFANQIQEYGQLVSGALPSLFGGQTTGGSGTASEYSMSRSQALQRLQTTWKMFTTWWKEIHGKVIPAYIKTVKEQGDERIVEKDSFGNFVNILIRKSELEGKIGNIEIEANENLPMTWAQRRDTMMKLMEANNPQILAMLAQPENLELIYETIGIPDFYVPGEDDRTKQWDEIKQLLASEPIPVPPSPEEMMQAEITGEPPQEHEEPSVEIDPIMDNHQIEFDICRKFAVSEAGQVAKIDNPNGYKNFLLHALQHKQLILPIPGAEGAAPLANPKQNKQAPITEDSNVQA